MEQHLLRQVQMPRARQQMMPNPSIEPTDTGKPVSAAHVKR